MRFLRKKKLLVTEINRSFSEDSWENYREVDKTTDEHWWDTVWFHSMMWIYTQHFCFELVTREIFSKTEEFILCICRFGEGFEKVPSVLYGGFWGN